MSNKPKIVIVGRTERRKINFI